MISLIFHTPTGWRWNKFPEKAQYGYTPSGLEEQGGWQIEGGEDAYYAKVAELMASALEVANHEEFISDTVRNGYHYINGMSSPMKKITGELCHWPGEVLKEKKAIVSAAGAAQYKMVAVLSLPKEKTEPKEQEVKEVLSDDIKKKMYNQSQNYAYERIHKWTLDLRDLDLVKHTYQDIYIKEILPLESDNEALRQSVREIVEKFEKTCYDPASMYHHIELKSAIERAKQKIKT